MAEDKYPIDLGREMDGPSLPYPSEIAVKQGQSIYYPCLNLEWEKPYDLPDEGVMTVRFKKVSESMTNRDDKKKYCVGLEILEILDTKEEEAEEKSEKSTGEILDDYIEEKE